MSPAALAGAVAGVTRLIICGGRDFDDAELFHTAVTDWIAEHGWPEQVITGGASGADAMGHAWGKENGIKTLVFNAAWGTYGKRAGLVRNGRMAAHAIDSGHRGGCLALPGGRGTADMIRQAQAAGLTVREVRP